MEYQEGYVYHINDEYFIKANDPNLMQNKENGSSMPVEKRLFSLIFQSLNA